MYKCIFNNNATSLNDSVSKLTTEADSIFSEEENVFITRRIVETALTFLKNCHVIKQPIVKLDTATVCSTYYNFPV